MALRLLVVVAATSLLAASTAIATNESSHAELAWTAQAKKAKKCKAKQVAVTVGKRKRVCRPLARFIPRPHAGDSRRIGVEGALSLDLGRVGGKRIPSLNSVLGRRRAATVRRKLLRLLPKLLARIDRSGAARAAADDDCGRVGPGFNGKTGGGSLGLANGKGQITAPAGGDRVVKVTFPAANCNRYEAERCPTAGGVVDGHAERGREIHLLIYDGDELLLNQSVRTTQRATLRGQVADDAKLDHLDVEDVVTYHNSSGGSSTAGNYNLVATITRTTRVDMRTGRYVPKEAAVKVRSRVNGLSLGPEEDLATATNLATKFAGDFAVLVDAAIGMYRGRETGWNEANACAKVDFSPASGQRILSRGETGTVTATVSANAGGSPPSARWTLGNPQNATFSPLQASANPFAASFTVSSSGSGHEVRGEFRATSRAGVAEGTWTQPIRELPNTISGTWHRTVNHQGQVFNITFNATFVRVPSTTPSIKGDYRLTSGTGTWSVTGPDPDTTCQIDGDGPFSGEGGGVILYTPGSATPGPPFEYLMQTGATDDFDTWNYHDCDDPGDNGPVERPVPFSGLNVSGTTSDGFTYTGSETQTEPIDDYTREDTWSFTGTL